MTDVKKEIRDLYEQTKLKDIMQKSVVTIRRNEDLSVAQVKFINHRLTHLIVVDEENKLAGVLSQKYLYKTQSPRKIIGAEELEYQPDVITDGDSYYYKETLDSYILDSVMNANPRTLSEEHSVADAIFLMAKQNLGCIPIIDENKKIKGLITNRDIVTFIGSVLGGG